MSNKDKDRRCLFCGKQVKDGGTAYCKVCRSAGFDEVHRFTGKSNGWDKKPRESVPIVSGWRGQPNIGGRIAR